MVYCTKCGTLNHESALNCSNCGAMPYPDSRSYRRYERRRYYEEYGYHHRGSGIGLLIAGLIIIVMGLAALTGFAMFWNYFWPFVLVIMGVSILLWGLSHTRRFRQAPSQ